jgi:YD repeat-containing protein
MTDASAGGSSSKFAYDGSGRLVQVVDSQSGAIVANHTYVWCGDMRCAQYDNMHLDANGLPTVSRLYVQQGMLVRIRQLYGAPSPQPAAPANSHRAS